MTEAYPGRRTRNAPRRRPRSTTLATNAHPAVQSSRCRREPQPFSPAFSSRSCAGVCLHDPSCRYSASLSHSASADVFVMAHGSISAAPHHAGEGHEMTEKSRRGVARNPSRIRIRHSRTSIAVPFCEPVHWLPGRGARTARCQRTVRRCQCAGLWRAQRRSRRHRPLEHRAAAVAACRRID